MRGIRPRLLVRLLALIPLAAGCCAFLLTPASATAQSWQPGPIEADLGEDTEFPAPGNHDPYPVSHEDLMDLDGPCDSQFPDLPKDVNPFYHAIETDRAAFTPAISSAPLGRMILESGYSFIANRGFPSDHSYPELMFRFGLAERLELRFGWNNEAGGAGNIVSPIQVQQGLVSAPTNPANPIAYENGFLYGFKLRVTEQSGWFPANTVIVQGFSPGLGDTKKTQMNATYAFGWEFAPRFRLDAAVRYATEAELTDNWSLWSPSAVLRAPFAERWTGTVEYFGVIPHGEVGGISQHFAGPGLQFLITPDAQLNLRVGTGLNSQSPEFYLSTGFGLAF